MRLLGVLLTLTGMIFSQSFTSESFGIEIGIGVGQYESDFVDQEMDVVEVFGLYRSFIHDETGEEKEVPLNYSYFPQSASVEIIYYPTERYGLGVNFQYIDIEQRYDFPSEFTKFESNESYIKGFKLGPSLNVSIFESGKLSFSLFARGYLLKGALGRVPLLAIDYAENDELSLFLENLNKEIDLNGWGYSIGPKVELSNTSRLHTFLKIEYDKSKVDLSGDPFLGYIKNNTTIEYTLTLGLSLLIEK